MKFKIKHTLAREQQSDIVFNIQTSYQSEQGILGIYGPSGTGKSSLLKILAGLNTLAEYSICVGDETFTNANATQNPCVYVGNELMLFEHINVLDNLQLVVKHSNSAKSAENPFDLDFVINQCKLAPLLASNIAQLSSGETQRVLFARALLSGKKVLLLDEAFSSLDWQMRSYFGQLTKKLQQHYGFHVLMVSHSLKELAVVCSHVWSFQHGTFVQQNDVDTALDQTQSQDEHDELFSVINASFQHVDETDEHLEVWQLSAHNNQAEQTIIKRAQSRSIIQYPNEENLIQYQQQPTSIIIEANKISLTFEALNNSSMLNCLRVQVVEIIFLDKTTNHTNGVVVKLDANGQVLRALISKRSYTHMNIKKGDDLFAIFKAV